MKAREIEKIVKATECRVENGEEEVERLLTDSRLLSEAKNTLFFAITSKKNSGARYIGELYEKGVRMFVVPKGCEVEYEGASVWKVNNVIEALQRIAEKKRREFDIPVVGITGSNGKTIVKDWLVQLLSPEGAVVSSPKSYNSQIGVPLSVWQMKESDRMGIFEAGISEAGEMPNLQNVIKPTIGVFTNIGQAHDENFLTRGQKIAEKLQLFTRCEVLIYSTDYKDIHSAVSGIESFRSVRLFTWGKGDENDIKIAEVRESEKETCFGIEYEGKKIEVRIPFVDRASQENAMHCVALMLWLGYDEATIRERCAKLTAVEMRLEMNEAMGNSLLINDSYSLDFNSLNIALDYVEHIKQHKKKMLIISDFMQTGLPEGELYAEVARLIEKRDITSVVCIGEGLCRNRSYFDGIEAEFYESTQEFIEKYNTDRLQNHTILLKGARVFGFEKIAKLLQKKNHETVMEVNLDALQHNLNFYRAKLKRETKLMAMVKASSYGAGRVEVASVLQYAGVDYLTVAYADEGVELRRGGITLPIMVMNPEEASFDDIIKYSLEPDIYSFRIMKMFTDRLRMVAPGKRYPIHIEFDTGMHRLGFEGKDVERLMQVLEEHKGEVEVRSVFTHLACADDATAEEFTRRQMKLFKEWSKELPGIKHILNSAGIEHYAEEQMDMVRLGIGLYGISSDESVQRQLKEVSRLTTKVSQVKEIKEGDTVGYNGRWKAERDSQIAIIPIGYADGMHRALGYERGRVMINGEEAAVVGSVCMDMTFVDVTDIKCEEGDKVVIFGDDDLLRRNAAACGTIPYELLTSVAPRVKRVYYHE